MITFTGGMLPVFQPLAVSSFSADIADKIERALRESYTATKTPIRHGSEGFQRYALSWDREIAQQLKRYVNHQGGSALNRRLEFLLKFMDKVLWPRIFHALDDDESISDLDVALDIFTKFDAEQLTHGRPTISYIYHHVLGIKAYEKWEPPFVTGNHSTMDAVWAAAVLEQQMRDMANGADIEFDPNAVAALIAYGRQALGC